MEHERNATQAHVSSLLRLNKRHLLYLEILVCLALVVAAIVPLGLRQRGVAMTHEETILDCHYVGIAAHEHTADCYDANGALVCPLPERELHMHDDGCYAEERVPACGLEEDESHQHSDACYETVRTLTCDKEEVAEEHVHGPGCFATVTVVDEDPAAAQVFEGTVERDDGTLYAKVAVEAPAGALPTGSSMKVEAVDAETVRSAVEDELVAAGEERTAELQAVRVTFTDAEGNECKPAAPVLVRLTSELVTRYEQYLVMTVDDEAKATRVTTLDEQALDERELAAAEGEVLFDAQDTKTIVLVGLQTPDQVQEPDAARTPEEQDVAASPEVVPSEAADPVPAAEPAVPQPQEQQVTEAEPTSAPTTDDSPASDESTSTEPLPALLAPKAKVSGALRIATANPTEVTVQKAWLHADETTTWPVGQDVRMALYRVEGPAEPSAAAEYVLVNGSGITNPVTLSADEPTYTWTDLPTVDDNENPIEYVVKEETAVPGYTTYVTTEDGSEQTDTAPVIGGLAHFTNHENEAGQVKIQITKYVQGEDGTLIPLLSSAANDFTILRSTTDTSVNVVDVNKGSFSQTYDTSSYVPVEALQVPVNHSGWGLAYADDLNAGMYTIVEDAASIPDELVDVNGKVWTYKETVIRTEYAWRQEGDESARHVSDVYTKENGSYTAVPEAAGAYEGTDGSDLYNEYLDFFVTNVYEESEDVVESQSMDLVLDKSWAPTTPDSGSVTFVLHQVRKTTVYDEGEGGEPAGVPTTVSINDPWNSGTVHATVSTYSDGSAICVGDEVSLFIPAWAGNEASNHTNVSGFNIQQVSSPSWGTVVQFTITDENPVVYFQYNQSISTVTNLAGSGPSATVTTIIDQPGSGFPKTIELTAPDWSASEPELLTRVVHGNETTEYSYYFEETRLTGLASAYTSLSFDGAGGSTNPVTGTGTVTVSATNSVPSADDTFIKITKTWWDQDGEELLNHPDEVLVDVYRMKLPGGASGSGEVSFNSVGGLYDAIGNPNEWQDNNNVILNDVVFQMDGAYYYIRNGQTNFSRSQLQAWENEIRNGYLNGAHVTKLTGKVWDLDELENNGAGSVVAYGDLCYYNDKYWVFRSPSGQLVGSEHTHGPRKSGNWSIVGEGNILHDFTISLLPNEEYLTEETIRDEYIPALYDAIDEQLEGHGVTWSDADKSLVLYRENVPITKEDDWQTSLTAEQGYLYFFFEKPIPGYVTMYGNEEHGVYDQDLEVAIVNQTSVGQLNVTKTWEGETEADRVYAKVFRDNVDITSELAGNPEAYGLTAGQFLAFGGQDFLVVARDDDAWETVQVKDLPIAPYVEGATTYGYAIEEVGYRESGTDHWGVSDVLSGYEAVDVDGTTTNTTGSASAEVKVGTIELVDGEAVYRAGTSTVTIGNASSADTTSFSFTKRWHDLSGQISSSWGGNITVTLHSQAGEVGTFTLSATGGTDGTYTWTGTHNADGTYTFVVEGLPKSAGGEELVYYVQEDTVAGYKDPSYALADGNVKVAGENQDKALDGEMVINSPIGGYELPAAGGSGVEAFTLTGILMMLVGSVGMLIRRMALVPREAYGSWESDCNELRKGTSEWRHLV